MRDSVWLTVVVSLAACKAPAWHKQKADADVDRNPPPPVVRSADGGAAASQAVEIEDKTGRTKSDIVLRLDYLPKPSPGTATLPLCYQVFDAEFEIGSIMCDGLPETQRALFAKNVDQECYTDSRRGRQPAAEPISLPGCRRGVIVTHKFEPRLRLDVELRDVN